MSAGWRALPVRIEEAVGRLAWNLRLVRWWPRKWFWIGLGWLKLVMNKPVHIPLPRHTGPISGRPQARRIEPVPLAQAIPGIPIDHILVCPKAQIPADQASRIRSGFYALQVWLYRAFSPMQPRLPSISADPDRALRAAFAWPYRRRLGEPALPAEYLDAVPDLGALAVRGPYACYTQRAAGGTGFEWDLMVLAGHEHQAGLRRLGVRVQFELAPLQRALRPVAIDCSAGRFHPGEPGWGLAVRLALCSATTHLSLVRHFNWVHLAAGAPIEIATRNTLPPDHPVLRLLWPYVFGTLQSNDMVTRGQMLPGGDFDTTFSFSFAGQCRLFDETHAALPWVMNDPPADAARRGVAGAGFETPTEDNLAALFAPMLAFTRHYLELYYPAAAGDSTAGSGTEPAAGACADAAAASATLRSDGALMAWLDELNRLVPGGVGVTRADVDFDALARLCARIVYMATAQHELLGSALWHYQLWTHRQPIRVYASGQPEPLDVYQRLVNANVNLNVHRRALMDDFSALALDGQAAAVMQQFVHRLQQLQADMEARPWAAWKLYPRVLKVNINA